MYSHIFWKLWVLSVFFLVGRCYEYSKSNSNGVGQRVYELEKESSVSPLDYRSLDDFKVSDYLLISDIEGNLHSIDRRSGSLIWTLPFDKPLIHLQSNTSSQSEDSNILWFVEPYNDGSLYYFTPEFGLNKLPASIKDLVLESPFSLTGDDKIYTGTRKTSLYTINIHTGEVIDQFGDGAKKRPRGRLNDSDYIMIGKTTYELTIHSRSNSDMVWYVTYSQWGSNNIDTDLMTQNQKSIDEVYFTPFHDKSLLAINKELGAPVWISKLPSLTVNVFDIFTNAKFPEKHVLLPHPLKVLNSLQLQDSDNDNINNDLCFVNKTVESDQWFAMSFLNYPTLIKSAPISHYQMSLFNLENQNVDINNLNVLRHLNVKSEENDKFVNGVHRFSKLNAGTSYQPVSKFKDTTSKYAIEGGSVDAVDTTANHELIVRESSTNLQIPDIIEGMKFTRPTSPVKDVLQNDQEYMLVEGRDTKNNVIPTYDETSFLDNDRIRRISKNVVVIALLGLLLTVVVKIKSITKEIRRWWSELYIDIYVRVEGSTAAEARARKAKAKQEQLGISSDKDEISSKEAPEATGVENSGSLDTKEILTSEKDKAMSSEEATKKKRKRGARGGRRGTKKKPDETLVDDRESKPDEQGDERESDSENYDSDNVVATTSLRRMGKLPGKSSKKFQIENDLIISNKILGYGSHGTVVFEGTFENRPVAVKRMLLDFFDVANHEVSLLQQSDDHPNVVRYFCSQSSVSEKFLYIALELCQGSLEDLIDSHKRVSSPLDIKALVNTKYSDLLFQLANGLHYLHNLKIVHRDMKPQNILIGDFKSRKSTDTASNIRLLISDFGLCKKLDNDQSSFRATTQNAASGTSGWRAPELLLNHDISEISPDTVASISSNSTGGNPAGGRRLTKAIDIFSLGCVFFYILTEGSHPFGDRYMREGNIINGKFDLSLLNKRPDSCESQHLIRSMIEHNPIDRPSTGKILKHPYFWSINKKLEFLLKVSDRFEIERRDPPSPLLLELERSSHAVTKGNWHKKFDGDFMNNLGKYRKYQAEKLMDLLRAIRNKYHHFNDMPDGLQKQMRPLPSGFYGYFSTRFPNLLMEIYFVVERHLKHEHIFEEFY